MKPTILIATATRWVPTARLVMALANAGCTVDAVCPSHHPVSKTGALRRAHIYHGLRPLASLSKAIAAARPDIIIPGDDFAAQQLLRLYEQERAKGKEGEEITTLIERSLGAPESFSTFYARAAFMDLAREEGIRIPNTEVIADTRALRAFLDRTGFPAVLKANGTSGGVGVKIVHSLEEAERGFRVLQAPPVLARAAKRALLDQDTTLVWPALLRRRSVVNTQAFIAGREATSAIACWKGEILAALHFEVLAKTESFGPASVVRVIDNAEMSAAAEKMARRLKLSGLHGFDYMVEAQTGNAYLIEMNPRATQVGHLALGPGRDLAATLCSVFSGNAVREAPAATTNKTIALFPQEWLRDRSSAFLRSGYHDVPWEEPELVRFCIRKPRTQSARNLQKSRFPAFSASRSPRP